MVNLKKMLCSHKYTHATPNVVSVMETGYVIMGYICKCEKCGKSINPSDTDLPIIEPDLSLPYLLQYRG